MTLFGNKIFADVVKVNIRMRSSWVKVSSETNESILVRKRLHRHTGDKWCEGRERDWSDANKPVNTRSASSHQKLEEKL